MKTSLRPVVPLLLALALAGVFMPWSEQVTSSAPAGHAGLQSAATGPDSIKERAQIVDSRRSPSTAPSAFDPRGAASAAATNLFQPAHYGALRVPTKADSTPAGLRQSLLLPANFLDKLANPDGTRVAFSLPDGRAAIGAISLLRSDESGVLSVQGRLEQPSAGTFFFQRQTAPGTVGALVGNVRLDQSPTAWRIDPAGPDGAPVLTEVRLDQVLCAGQPMPENAGISEPSEDGPEAPVNPAGKSPERPSSQMAAGAPGTPQQVPQAHPSNIAIPAVQNGVVPLQSLPGAAGVIYLDFDGEPGPFTGWSAVTGDAAPSGATTSQIKDVWQRVSEDYQAFNLNITTDRGVFDRAAENSRQHVVITPTSAASPGAGGVAFVGSFNWTGDTVCWAFIRMGKNAAEAISHEVGHTLGLSHDGRNSPVEEYYGGQGSGDTGWAPIMGVGYSKNLSQWSKGEYAAANNSEDDLTIIVNNNNAVDYRADDTSAAYATADYLDILPDFTVSNEGIIETRADVDAWRFQTTGGEVSLTVSTVTSSPDVDLLAEIYNSDDILIASANPDTLLGATVSAALDAGNYTLRISGVGRGDPLTTGYTDYGSLGAYLLSGTVTDGVRHDRFALNENSPNGTVAGTPVTRLLHEAGNATFQIASGNTGGAFTIDPATGQLTVANSTVLNYETLSTQWDDPASLQLFIVITDSADAALDETLRVVVTVNPLNEPPSLTGGMATLLTRTPAGVPVFQVTGSDPDRFDFPLFSILSGNTGGAFAIDPASGRLTTTASFPAVLPAVPYVLTIRATDRATPALTADATVSLSVIEAPAGYTPGGWMRTYYEGINGNSLSNLTSNARFTGNQPDSEELQSYGDTGRHGNNYGSTARAWLIPPVTGTYTFWITSDDTSELRLGSNAAAASATVRASAAGATGRYQYNRYPSQQSAPVSLTAGQPYYFEARHKQGTGADHLVIAWQGPGFARTIITGAHLAALRQNFAPRITAQNFPVRRGSDNGTTLGSVAVTEANTADTHNSWTITGGTAASWCAIDANAGLLYVADAAALNAVAAVSQTLTVRVSDNAVVPLAGTGTITLNLVAPGAIRASGIVQQIWTGIPGNNVSALTADLRYPNAPVSTRILTGFDSGTTGLGDNYGSRIRALVTPPAGGSYTFYIAGDDESQLRFTAGPNFASAPQIAFTSNATARDAWTTNAAQQSAPVLLNAGQKYYIEARHKNGAGADFVQVAWTGPGIASPTVIPASALEAFDLNAAPVWSSAPYNFTVRQHAPPGTPAGLVAAVDPDGTQPIYSITGGNPSGAFSLNPFTGLLTPANRSALIPGSVFTLNLRVQDNGVGSVYPFKSAATTATVTVAPDFVLVRPAARTVNLPAAVGLDLEATPSGRPGAAILWACLSGPGPVAFDNATAYATGVQFSTPGLYLLRGTETAGDLPVTLDLTVQSGSSPGLPGGDRIGAQVSVPNHTWTAGLWQLNAGGTGLANGTADSFYFINQPALGNATITARVTGVSNLNGANSLAGIMLRESGAPDARSIFCGVNSLNGRRLILRTTAGLPAVTAAFDNPASTAPFTPVWVRLSRSGNVFTAATAADVSGSPGPFTTLGTPQTFPMAPSSLIGLAAASGLSATRGTALLDNLTVTPSLLNMAPDPAFTAPEAITLPLQPSLSALVTDDARPSFPGATTQLWQKSAGPGPVVFSAPAALNTNAAFSIPGSYQLRLSADDGEIRTFRDTTLTVSPQTVEAWRQSFFNADADNPLIAGDTADPDGDALPNLVEYALGLNPLTADADPLTATAAEVEGQIFLRLALARNPAVTGVVTSIETTTDPSLAGSWSTRGLTPEVNTPTTLQARTTEPLSALPAQFLRVKVSR